MPISLEQPGMVSPQITGIYGAALQWSQDAGPIASLAGQEAQLNSQAAARGDQMRLANAALGAHSANEQADRYWRSQAANADREQSALNVGATLTQRNDEAQLHANTQLIGQQRGAELAVWANGQELTQADQMQQQKLARTVGLVMNDPNLGPVGEMTPDRMNVLTQVRTGLDPLNEKLKQAQIKSTEAMTQLHQTQLEQKKEEVVAMAKWNKMTEEERKGVDLTPEAQAELNSMDLTPQQRDVVRNGMIAKGRGRSYTIQPDGTLAYDKPVPNSEEKAHEAELKHFEAADRVHQSRMKFWNDSYTEEMKRVEKVHEARNDKDPSADILRREVEDNLTSRKVYHPGPPPAPPQRPGQAQAAAPAATGTATSDSAVSQAAPSPAVQEFQKKVVADNKPFKIGEGTAEQNMAIKDLADTRAAIATIPGLATQDRQMFEQQATTAMQLYSQYGSVPGMNSNPQAAQLFNAIMASLKQIASQAQPREDQKPASTPSSARPPAGLNRDLNPIVGHYMNRQP